MGGMDIEQFYDADPRRRPSTEVEFGTEWKDGHGIRYELDWIADTGELYAMREPVPPGWEDPFGGIHVRSGDSAPTDGMTVTVVANIATRESVEDVLRGWEQAIDQPNSIDWLVQRLATRVRPPRVPSHGQSVMLAGLTPVSIGETSPETVLREPLAASARSGPSPFRPH